jgi:hypothetical protein
LPFSLKEESSFKKNDSCRSFVTCVITHFIINFQLAVERRKLSITVAT